MFRGNPQHTGVYESAGVPKFSKVKWSFHTGGKMIGSPAVVDRTAYRKRGWKLRCKWDFTKFYKNRRNFRCERCLIFATTPENNRVSKEKR